MNGLRISRGTALFLSFLMQFGAYLAITWFYGWGLASLMLIFAWGLVLQIRVEISDAVTRFIAALLHSAGVKIKDFEPDTTSEDPSDE